MTSWLVLRTTKINFCSNCTLIRSSKGNSCTLKLETSFLLKKTYSLIPVSATTSLALYSYLMRHKGSRNWIKTYTDYKLLFAMLRTVRLNLHGTTNRQTLLFKNVWGFDANLVGKHQHQDFTNLMT